MTLKKAVNDGGVFASEDGRSVSLEDAVGKGGLKLARVAGGKRIGAVKDASAGSAKAAEERKRTILDRKVSGVAVWRRNVRL